MDFQNHKINRVTIYGTIISNSPFHMFNIFNIKYCLIEQDNPDLLVGAGVPAAAADRQGRIQQVKVKTRDV